MLAGPAGMQVSVTVTPVRLSPAPMAVPRYCPQRCLWRHGKRLISSATCASTRLGAALRSWPPPTRSTRFTILRRAGYRGCNSRPGHPSDQWGFAVGAGLRLNFPMIAQGDYFPSQVNYTQGASRYPVTAQ